MNFYDEICSFYDEMTRMDERVEREMNVLKLWVQEYGIRSAMDVGCGSGVTAIALAKLGTKVYGIDPSPKMIDKAKKNTINYGIKSKFKVSKLEDLVEDDYRNLDAVFILGNTLAHILTPNDLKKALSRLFSGLKRGGICVIQLLNYAHILKEKERIIAINERNNHQYIRFHDFLSPLVQFNILHVVKTETGHTWSLHSTRQYPYTADFFIELEQQQPDVSLRLFSGMDKSGFHEDSSRNLICLFEKQ